MNRALALTTRQAQALLRAAAKERAVVEVKLGDTVVRLIPESLAQAQAPIVQEKVFDL